MAKSRRSISVKGITYQRVKNHCEAVGKSISGYLEEIIKEKLDEAGVPVPEVLEQPKRKHTSEETDEIASQHFTF